MSDKEIFSVAFVNILSQYVTHSQTLSIFVCEFLPPFSKYVSG